MRHRRVETGPPSSCQLDHDSSQQHSRVSASAWQVFLDSPNWFILLTHDSPRRVRQSIHMSSLSIQFRLQESDILSLVRFPGAGLFPLCKIRQGFFVKIIQGYLQYLLRANVFVIRVLVPCCSAPTMSPAQPLHQLLIIHVGRKSECCIYRHSRSCRRVRCRCRMNSWNHIPMIVHNLLYLWRINQDLAVTQGQMRSVTTSFFTRSFNVSLACTTHDGATQQWQMNRPWFDRHTLCSA